MKKISICIPTWECYGKGNKFLFDLLCTIENQTFRDYEVCISDHSEDDNICNEIKKFETKIDIKYQKNTNYRGNSPQNTNRAIEMCSGEIIKIMFQDDFFYRNTSLEKIYNEFQKSDKMWLVCGCNHTDDNKNRFYNFMYPRWNDNLLFGVNTISSPSVVSFRKEIVNRFDENLVYFMDCEFYYGMDKKYGKPIFLNDILVTNRMGNFSITTNISNKNKNYYVSQETKYCREKYGI